MAIIDNYSSYSWKDKELITATKLNRIENTLAALAENGLSCKSDSSHNINGILTFNNITDWGAIETIMASGGSDTGGGEIFYAKRPDYHKWYFRHYLPDSSSLYEQYSLPPVDTTITNAKGYEILTTKTSGKVVDSGEITTTVESVSTNFASSGTAIGSIVLTPGTWILTANVAFNNNSSGWRWFGIHTISGQGSKGFNRYAEWRATAVVGSWTVGSCTSYTKITSNTTYYLNVIQTSGSDLSVTGGLVGIRLV